jgi:hypothetical protein
LNPASLVDISLQFIATEAGIAIAEAIKFSGAVGTVVPLVGTWAQVEFDGAEVPEEL